MLLIRVGIIVKAIKRKKGTWKLPYISIFKYRLTKPESLWMLYILLQHTVVSWYLYSGAISIPSFCTERPISTLPLSSPKTGDTANVIELDHEA